MPIKDLTGKRFNKLVVKKFTGTNDSAQAMWLCICDCGNQKTVSNSHLRTGNTKSCGKCIKRKGALPKDITGKKFGKLTAVKNTGVKKHSTYLWECLCDCGNTRLVNIRYLKNGLVTACGGNMKCKKSIQ